MGTRPRRILLTKSALDAHDRGVRTIARALRDAGLEVVFTRFELPEEIIKPAQEEDVDLVGISSSMGEHRYIVPRVTELLKERGLDHIGVIVGGIIPEEDIPELLAQGVGRVFGPGTSTQEVVDYLRALP